MMPSSEFALNRFLRDETLEMIEEGLEFLLKHVRESSGELDLQIRNNYVNIYFEGNSLAKVEPLVKLNAYRFTVNKSFSLRDITANENSGRNFDRFFKETRNEDVATVPRENVHAFFKKKVVNDLKKNIRKRGYQEEITFEQRTMADNFNREEFIIIDRQVQMEGDKKRKMDLLALRRQVEGSYRFVVLELKLGNNFELKEKVSAQLSGYVQLLDSNFSIFANCYEKNYIQKRRLQIIGEKSWPERIIIEKPVEGRIVVGHYPGMGREQIRELLANHPELKGCIDRCWNHLPKSDDCSPQNLG